MNIDSLYRAAEHVEKAASLGFVSPAVLKTAYTVERSGFRRQKDCRFPEHSTERFEDLESLWTAYNKRLKEMERQGEKRDVKFARAPLSYQCAAERCGIEATRQG